MLRKTHLTHMNRILQSNWRVWLAITSVRVQCDPATICELRDALNRRRDMRIENDRLARAVAQEVERDVRTWGKIERTHGELTRAALATL